MVNKKRENTYVILRGICFALFYLTVFILYSSAFSEDEDIGFFGGFVLTLLYGLPFILYAWSSVTLFFKSKKTITTAFMVDIILLTNISRSLLTESYLRLLDVLAGVLICVCLILTLLNKKTIVSKIWFSGSVLQFVVAIATIITYIYNGSYRNVINIFLLFLVFIKAAGFLFIGLWIKESVCSAKTEPINRYDMLDSQSIDAISRNCDDACVDACVIDKLKMYKDLLDSGVITQDEFDKKKKEILGL